MIFTKEELLSRAKLLKEHILGDKKPLINPKWTDEEIVTQL